MHDKLFCMLADWQELREEQNEYTETLSRLAGLPNTVETILAAYKDAIEREFELWQKLSNSFESEHQAISAFVAESNRRNQEESH